MSRHRGYSDKEDYVRCSACDFPNLLSQRSTGHEYISQSTSISGATQEAYEADSGGCARCFCPDWNSGGKITWSKRGRF